MKFRTLPLLAAFLLTLSLSACGAPPTADDPVGHATFALNGFSVPPPGGWGTEPWLCAGAQGVYPAWRPSVSPWPMNAVNSWCQWQPSSTAGIYPYRVSTCNWSTDPAWPGTAYLYQYPNFQGGCAMIYADRYPAAPYQYDADLVESNGWHSVWTPPGGTIQAQAVGSFKIGPYTSFYACEGPFTGPAGAPCQTRTVGIGSFTSGANYPYVTYSDGSGFTIAAIQIQATAQ